MGNSPGSIPSFNMMTGVAPESLTALNIEQ